MQNAVGHVDDDDVDDDDLVITLDWCWMIDGWVAGVW